MNFVKSAGDIIHSKNVRHAADAYVSTYAKRQPDGPYLKMVIDDSKMLRKVANLIESGRYNDALWFINNKLHYPAVESITLEVISYLTSKSSCDTLSVAS